MCELYNRNSWNKEKEPAGLMNTHINWSLERIAEIAGDPAPAVYERLFELHPEMKELFILDKTSSARGHMLAEALDCVLDYCDGDHYATNFVDSEKTNHDGIGVPPDVFSSFLPIVVEVFQEILGGDWTAEIDKAWKDVLVGLNGADH